MSRDVTLRLLAAAESGGRRWLQALRHAESIDTLLGMDRSSLLAAGLSSKEIARLRHARRPRPDWQDWLEQPDHSLIVYGSEHYPAQLATIADAPLALWAIGPGIPLLQGPQLAIVGSRHSTLNGTITAENLARALSLSGLTITSGLALGIDAASHRGALGGCGSTIAVLGSGVDRIYPHRNQRLAAEIRQQGLIVSEYGPGVPIRPWQFPHRNRIIAGLTLGTLVVEASSQSGSLITARLASEYGREVFAIPGSIHNALSKGCHKLIRDGAKLVEQTADILIEISPQLAVVASAQCRESHERDSDSLPERLHHCLDFSPVSFDSMLNCSGLTSAELSSMLLHLELQGKIEALPGGRYCRLAKRA